MARVAKGVVVGGELFRGRSVRRKSAAPPTRLPPKLPYGKPPPNHMRFHPPRKYVCVKISKNKVDVRWLANINRGVFEIAR